MFMKRANYLLIALSVMLITTSCSGIRRYTTYHPYKEKNKWENQHVNYSVPMYYFTIYADIVQNINYVVADKDTLFLQIIPGTDGLFGGPVLLPVIPICLAPWVQDQWSKLEIMLFSRTIEKYGIDSTNIHFIINNKKEIYPIEISQKQGEKVFYFDEKMKEIKELAIHIDSVNYHIPPLFLKRKYKLDYRPFFWH
jgi:hypothetical protein